MVLILAQLILCTSLAAILYSANWYLSTTKDRLNTSVTSISGTVLVRTVSSESPIPVLRNSQFDAEEASTVSTDDTSQAILTFFDGSTITLFGNTTLIIRQSNRPRFTWSDDPERIDVELVKGRIRASPSDSTTGRAFTVITPHGQTALNTGSFAVEANSDKTQVTSRLGVAEISAQGKTIQIDDGLRSEILPDAPPADALAAEQNLLTNSDFGEGFEETWNIDIFVPETASDVITATVNIETLGDSNAVAFNSFGEDNIHTDAAIEQVINKDVQGFQSLRVNADILLNYQSLPGGGFLGTEFPILLKLAYKDADGNDREWYRGFYYEPPPDNYILHNRPDNSSEDIGQTWFPYESENLLEILGDIKPVYVKSLRIYASGWIYDAKVTNVKLLAQD